MEIKDIVEKRETVGKVAVDLMSQPQEALSPIELEREMQSEYMKHLMDCIDAHYEIFPGDFFIQVITKNEKLLPNVFRNYFAARRTCPTPDYDQSVYKYNRFKGTVEYIWTVPSKDSCYHLLQNYNEVAPEERQLLTFVAMFASGELAKVCLKQNGEKIGDQSGIVSVIH